MKPKAGRLNDSVVKNRVKNTTHFSEAFMVGYTDEGRARFENTKHSWVQLDGTSLSGQEIEFYAVMNTERRIAMWMPPKVFY